MRVNTVDALIQEGRIDEVRFLLAFAPRIFRGGSQPANAPMGEPWAKLSFLRRVAIWSRAATSSCAFVAWGPRRAGYSVSAVSEDRLIRVFGKLGRWDAATDAWVRARALRAEYGAVRTLHEREATREARHALKQQVGEEAMHAAACKLSRRTAGPVR